MADYSKTVDIIFGGKDNASAIAKGLSTNLRDLETGLTNASAPFASAFDSIVKIDLALAALGAAMVGFSIKEAAQFQQANAEISTLLSLQPDQMDAFSLAIRDYAATSTSSIDDINRAVYSAISAGVDYADTLGALGAAEQLATASNADLNSTLVLLASSMNAYGVEADQAEAFSDALFTTVRLGQTTLPELASSLGRVSATAANSGVDFDTLTAAIAALTAGGIKTKEAVSGLKAAISNILKPTTDAAAEAERLGIQFDGAALRSKGLDGVLQSITGSSKYTDDSLVELFGSVEALNVVMSLTGVSSSKFEEALSAMEVKSGATATAFAKMSDTVTNKIQTMINNMRLVLIESGLKILDEFGGDVDGLSEIFKALRFTINETEAFDPVYDSLNTFFNDVERVLKGIAAALPEALQQVDFTGLLGSFGELGEAIGSLFGDLDLTQPEDLAAAIQTLVNGGEALVRITKGIVESFQPLFAALGKGITEFNGMDKSMFDALGNMIGIGKQVNILASNMGPLNDGIKLVAAGMFSLAGVNLAGVLGVAGAATAAVATGAVAAGVGLGYLVEETTGLGTAVGNVIPKIWGDGSNSLGTAIYEWINGTEEAERVTALLAPTVLNAGAAAETAAEGLSTIGDATSNLDTQPIDAMGVSMEEMAAATEKYGSAFEVIDGKIVPTLESAGDAADAAGDSHAKWVQTMVDGVPTFTQVGDGISSTYKKAAESAKEATKETDTFRLKMEEIASNERIATIEATVDLNIAQLEADAEVAKAIIDSISTTIQSTGDVISSLFGIYDEADRSTQIDLDKQLRFENELREQAAEDQHRLAEQQIEAMKARTDALRNGDGLIKITADGLEPELEAFMWKILERIQIQASLDESAFLLGIPG